MQRSLRIQDYEQHPQTDRELLMVHCFYCEPARAAVGFSAQSPSALLSGALCAQIPTASTAKWETLSYSRARTRS